MIRKIKLNAKKAKPSRFASADKSRPSIDRFRAQHMALSERVINGSHGAQSVTIDDAESPLVWLARRRGRDGAAMIAPHQLQAVNGCVRILRALT